MKPEDVPLIYDREYAEAYDGRFLTADYTSPNTEKEVEILESLLTPDATWLDVGCGTGFYLSKFPDMRRAGLDASPAMLDLAKARNPGAEFRLGDFREPVDEWSRAWSVVSCMWSAYAYVETIADVEQAVANMIEWTAVGGTLFIPILDLLTLRKFDIDFHETTAFFSGEVLLNGCIWSWTDGNTGKVHRNMIAPQADQFVEWLGSHFEDISFILYPTVEGMANREALVATKRRARADHNNLARVGRSESRALAAVAHRRAMLDSMTVEALLSEVFSRARPRRMLRGVACRLRRLLGWSDDN